MKLREDAEREARIAAEVAEAGESAKDAEERELSVTLRPLGLRLREIPADGHCLYRSLGETGRQAGIQRICGCASVGTHMCMD